MLIRALKTVAISMLLASPIAYPQTSDIPNPSRAEVYEIFGNRLNEGSRADDLLMLAIALDSQSHSATSSLPIGIPYIIRAGGPGYWATLYAQGDHTVDVLVNSALLLLYMQEGSAQDESARREGALKLLMSASEKGYWPADVYIAQAMIEESLNEPVFMRPAQHASLKRAHAGLVTCANIDFAPCQLDLAIWMLTQGPVADQDAVALLRRGIDIAARDKRYLHSQRVLKDLSRAIKVLLMADVELSNNERELYIDFQNHVVSILSADERSMATR